jgi:hypothetical protein
MPCYPAAALYPHDDTSPESYDEKRRTSHLLERGRYHSVIAQAGDLMFITNSVPHFGTRNFLPENRLVLFDILSNHEKHAKEDNQQWFAVRHHHAEWS